MIQPLYHTIEGVEGREPVGAVLTAGRKGEKGNPIENDRFFFVSPYEVNGVRHPLPEFRRFNEAPPEKRQTIRGNLVHATVEEAWLHHLRAQKLPKPNPNPPARKPACTGDGARATRFKGMRGDEEVWEEIACPNRMCEFRQGSPAACKPMGRLYFRPLWVGDELAAQDGKPRPSLPTPLVKWSTGSWNSVANLVGFFDHIQAQARNLQLREWSIYGLPFQLTLGRKTQPQHERAFPVVSISPLMDLVEFFLMQRRRLGDAGARLALAAGNTAPEETAPEVIAADFAAINPGVPGRVVAVTPEPTSDTERVEAEITATVEAIDGILAMRFPEAEKYRNSPDARARGEALRAAFGVADWQKVQLMSLDALNEGLARLRGSAAVG